MPSRNTIEIVINATDNASRVFNSIAGETQKLGTIIGVGITAGLAVATTAITGFAAKGLQEFMRFEQGMNEVFTLIPGASDEMMSKLESDVKRLSQIYGVLPEQTIPALYQAISAGVPADNVYSFLEIANKAAIGGVTSLETAVDGITSVVNAYGSEIIDASKASDLMFTTVRLGKTNFELLSQSLFQVIPTASALGVSFEDVSAALAAITAQGTPTSVATTQLRQMFVELSKDGSKTSDMFKELAGKSFTEFIASGGNVQEALQLLEKHAKASGLGISDLFGSVEAGNAALQLTGQGTERFTDFLGQMGEATGATDTAFKKMSEGVQFQANRLQAKLSVLFTEIGEKLAPFAAQAFEDLGDVVSGFIRIVTGGLTTDTMDDFLGEISPTIRPIMIVFIKIGDEIRRVTGIIGRFIAGVKGGVPFLDNLSAVIYTLFPKDIADVIKKIIDGINNLWMAIKPVINGIIKFVSENVELKDVLIAVGIALGSVVIPAIIGVIAAIAPLIGTFALLIGGVTLLRQAWENDFLGIQTFVMEKLIPALQTLANWFIKDALPKAIAFVQNVAIPAFQLFVNWLSGIWESVKPHLENLANWFIGSALPAVVNFITGVFIPAIGSFIQILINIWNFVKPHLDNLVNWFINDALPSVISFIQNTVIPGIQSFIDLLVGIWDLVSPVLTNLFDWFMTTALPVIVEFINTIVIPGIQSFIDLLVSIWGTVSPVLQVLLDWFITDGLPQIVDFFNEEIMPKINDFIDLLKGIWNSVSPGLQSLKDGIKKVFDWIKTNVIDPIIGRIQEFITTLQGLGAFGGAAQNASTALGMVQSGQVSPGDFLSALGGAIGSELGFANGLPYAARDMTVGIHQGERVLTKEQNRNYSEGDNNKPSIVIENISIGNVKDQNDANEKAEQFVRGLRLQGVEI